MGTLADALNGTNVILKIANGGGWLTIGGQLTHTVNENNAPIDKTNKASQSWRELIDGEGLQTVDVTSEIIFSNDAALRLLKTASRNKTVERIQVVAGGTPDMEFDVYVVSVSDSNPDNDKKTGSLNLQSTGAMV
jgi:predicted secreted protein